MAATPRHRHAKISSRLAAIQEGATARFPEIEKATVHSLMRRFNREHGARTGTRWVTGTVQAGFFLVRRVVRPVAHR